MSSDKPSADAHLEALAAEALDLWQEHLSSYANDPKAKAELMHLLEPSRRMFADWAAMMQTTPHDKGAFASKHPTPTSAAAAANPPPRTATGAAAARPASDDSALRMAQLAHRVAELEKRVARLEPRSGPQASKTTEPRKQPKPRV